MNYNDSCPNCDISPTFLIGTRIYACPERKKKMATGYVIFISLLLDNFLLAYD